MPRKSKQVNDNEQVGQPADASAGKFAPDMSIPSAPPKHKQCGHVNRHSGAMNLKCTREPGHDGNHTAPYVRLDLYGNNVNDTCAWSDGAGEPPR